MKNKISTSYVIPKVHLFCTCNEGSPSFCDVKKRRPFVANAPRGDEWGVIPECSATVIPATFFVIPAKAGIQKTKYLAEVKEPGSPIRSRMTDDQVEDDKEYVSNEEYKWPLK